MSYLDVSVDIPDRLEASLTAEAGQVIGIVGPNGSGKTTLMRGIAGTLPAKVTVDGQEWSSLPPQQRSAGLVFQQHLLFEHLSALENVAYGPRARGQSRRAARRLAADWLARMGLSDCAAKRPDQLSGGQAQRVAIARSLAIQPRVLLLDEPFAALDVIAAIELRELLADHLLEYDGVVVLATHEPLDVWSLANRVVVLEGGRIAQSGTPRKIGEAPATAHAARLLGINLWRGHASGSTINLDTGGRLVTATPATGAVVATFPPSAVTLDRSRPTGSARNQWSLRVHTAIPRDDVTRVHLIGEQELYADVTHLAAEQLQLNPDLEVWASVKATEVSVFAVGSTKAGPVNSGHDAEPSARST